MIRAIHGAPAEALRQALEALAGLSFWISWTSDPDLGPEPFVSARCMRDTANTLRKAARLLDDAADRADSPPETARRATAPVSDAAPEDTSGGGAGPPAADTQDPWEHRAEAEPSPARTGECRPERAAFAPPIRSSMEIRMNHTTPPPEPLIREVPLSCLALAPENVRKTPANQFAEAELVASIKAHGLLENLVARADDPDGDGTERFAVVAGGRRLAALKALAEDGTLDADHRVPCKIAANGNAGELSLAENVIRIAMHPADQVVAFSQLAQSGITVAAIAARFGVAERLVEQRLRLGNAAPELLDAYRADDIDLETLKAFSVTTDHDRQRTIWERVAGQGYRPSAWQVKRMLTEERVPAGSPMARFVGVNAYEAAGGPVLRDLFADEHENGVWLEEPGAAHRARHEEAPGSRRRALDPLEVGRGDAGRRLERHRALRAHPFRARRADRRREGRNRQTPHPPRRARQHGRRRVDGRAGRGGRRHRAAPRRDRGRDRGPRPVQAGGLRDGRAASPPSGATARSRSSRGWSSRKTCRNRRRPQSAGTGTQSANGGDTDTGSDSGRIAGPAMSTPMQLPKDREAEARKEAGVGIGLGDDLRSIRTALVKAHLAGDFEAAFDLMVFQLVRAVFAQGYTGTWHALDIAFNETADRPTTRTNDDDFAAWSPGEAMLADWSHYPFERGWRATTTRPCFAALRALPRADKEKLFAAAVARTVKGQLAFEHGARPELEATVARLDIDFAKHVRPTADMLWSRIRKDRILDVARQTLGTAWASARSKYKKADLATAMEEAFAAGTPPVGIGATAHAAALAWTMPGFAAFDTGGTDDDTAEAAPVEKPADAPDASGDADPAPADKPRKTSVVESIESPAVAEQRAAALAAAASEQARESSAAPEPDGGEASQPRRDRRLHGPHQAHPRVLDGGGTGRSYHADLSCANTERRIHYLLEPGWRADQAIQGLGRTHRTHQASAPLFRPVTTDVKGEKRFIATIARRLDSARRHHARAARFADRHGRRRDAVPRERQPGEPLRQGGAAPVLRLALARAHPGLVRRPLREGDRPQARARRAVSRRSCRRCHGS